MDKLADAWNTLNKDTTNSLQTLKLITSRVMSKTTASNLETFKHRNGISISYFETLLKFWEILYLGRFNGKFMELCESTSKEASKAKKG